MHISVDPSYIWDLILLPTACYVLYCRICLKSIYESFSILIRRKISNPTFLILYRLQVRILFHQLLKVVPELDFTYLRCITITLKIFLH